ncbi:MAG: phosphoribosylformylglycinamidine synthase subunit PurL [Methylacidiphilales bacterium]|nr:phosphoribosylformylglycinamidine synthase subunit PurL [Candidatus Methylacidiphilales bacterium]MDW8348864.1 phosphoribosylformylglycinamidine synthase subunit PurL [Verrucomicrobiae bacterium]
MNPPIPDAVITRHGLTSEEYQRIYSILGRHPNLTELGIYSVMWSEHCSYKNSKPELKKFPTRAPQILVPAGEENAGVVDIGDGWAVAFKIESHNHPSAVEPFQGAATGVGGIIRDIFTMGARPLFLMNSLRFGEIRGDNKEAKKNRRLLSGVVAGIAHYGNCVGLPTIGGELQFDPSYNHNPLVNVFCLGILQHREIRRARAQGEGNPVFYVGAHTGRDGLAGAAFASKDLTEDSKAERPAVQVGDPFMEKLLMEACLELFQTTDAVVGVQDMGAAGLTCSTCETAARAEMGIEIELQKVPQREPGMTPYEIMLSESQERMLIIAQKGREKEVLQVFQKWEIPAAEIGYVTSDGMLRVKDKGKTVAEIPARSLTEDAPVYHREACPPRYLRSLESMTIPTDDSIEHCSEAILRLLRAPSIASKRWVYRQFDHQVKLGTVILPGGDAAVFRVLCGGKWKYLAATIDCNARYCYLNPRRGAQHAVAEAVRNLACVGARPLGATDNLNFGNPYDPEIFWQLRECVEGMAEACQHFGIPITGGNVSLYNQSPNGAIDPTPTFGLVGLIEDEKMITRQSLNASVDELLLLGSWGDEIGASIYAYEIHGLKAGSVPRINLEFERAITQFLLELIHHGWIRMAHDLSEGGLAVAVAESYIQDSSASSLTIEVPEELSLCLTLFNETASRILIGISQHHLLAVLDLAQHRGMPCLRLGRYEKNTCENPSLHFLQGTRRLSLPKQELIEAYESPLPRLMEGFDSI